MRKPFSNDPSYIELTGTTIYETDMAVLFDFGGDENKWVPKSCLEDWPDIRQNGEVIIKEQFALEKGLI
jgi:hypothetical protein